MQILGTCKQPTNKINCYNCCSTLEYEIDDVKTDQGTHFLFSVSCPKCYNEIPVLSDDLQLLRFRKRYGMN